MIISDNKQTYDTVIIPETSQLLPLISWPQQEHIAKRRRSVIRLRDRAADWDWWTLLHAQACTCRRGRMKCRSSAIVLATPPIDHKTPPILRKC